MSDVDVRPLRIDDVVAAQAAAYNALRDAGKNSGWEGDARTRRRCPTVVAPRRQPLRAVASW
ncbi:MAG TPA: hypothetical protein VN738_11765, partial [Acidothermaceae bacterium]|nr:hypothetical protein [Acidothermaceae bacterium]